MATMEYGLNVPNAHGLKHLRTKKKQPVQHVNITKIANYAVEQKNTTIVIGNSKTTNFDITL